MIFIFDSDCTYIFVTICSKNLVPLSSGLCSLACNSLRVGVASSSSLCRLRTEWNEQLGRVLGHLPPPAGTSQETRVTRSKSCSIAPRTTSEWNKALLWRQVVRRLKHPVFFEAVEVVLSYNNRRTSLFEHLYNKTRVREPVTVHIVRDVLVNGIPTTKAFI